MQLPSILLLVSAAVSASAYPAATDDSSAIEGRDAAEASTNTGPKDAAFACNQANNIVSEQIAELAKLKAKNISVPPYLSGYYTAINSERSAIGCPEALVVRKRSFTPLQEPCDVLNDQHERMLELIDRFQKDNIGVAPFISGFLSATLDEKNALGCGPFTGTAADEPVVDAEAADNDEDVSSG